MPLNGEVTAAADQGATYALKLNGLWWTGRGIKMTRLATYNTRAKAKFLRAARPEHELEAGIALKARESLWSTSIMPEGCLEHWRVADGARVHPGQALADLRIEGALHEILAPAAGRLVQSARVNSVVEPGDLLGRVQRDRTGG